MGKKYRSKHRNLFTLAPFVMLCKASLPIASILFFAFTCLNEEASIKSIAALLIPSTLACGVLGFRKLRERVTLPFLALFLVVLMDACTLFYAPSGKLALYEFLQVVNSFCLAILLLLFAKGEKSQSGRWIASVLEGSAALAGLVSVDLISTRWISGPVLRVLSLFNPRLTSLNGLKAGTRITSIFVNPNVFAGVIGLGVMLSLGLVLSSEERRERLFHLVCLFINALAFVLAFSMGASAAIAVAFLAYLVLEKKGRRAALFILMLKTLALTVLAAALISLTSFQPWSGIQPVPLLSLVVGAAVLCLSDILIGHRLTEKLDSSKKLPLMIGGAVVALIVFLVAAYSVTGSAVIRPGEGLRRAAYPASGDYVLHVESNGPVSVKVESQNRQDTMMHTSTILYQGDLAGAAFTVPEDSMVVYFNFAASQETLLNSVTYEGTDESGSVPLGYRLLPGFIANRLQGLWANQNAIQRLVFFADGMKLFRRSPVVGLGLGSFENASASVQTFYYETRYTHNHYVQALVDTGIIGLVLFVGLLAVSAVAVLLEQKREASHPLTPALGAALVFMAGHAATEIVFSNHAYLPMAYGVFLLIGLCCVEVPPERFLTCKIKTGILVGVAAVLIAFDIPFLNNLEARKIFQKNPSLSGLVQAEKIDKFEWADYALTYVINTMGSDVDTAVRQQADEYAQRLSHLDSNFTPLPLCEYYLRTGRIEEGMAMAEKYVTYVSANPDTWQKIFDLLVQCEIRDDAYRSGVARIKQLMDEWNAKNMGEIQLNEGTQAFISKILG